MDTSSASLEGEASNANVAQDFLSFWLEHTAPHFREEEEVLLPAFARYGDPSAQPVVRMLAEHAHLRRMVDDLRQEVARGEPEAATMLALGDLLRQHIRHEEDVVFPLIEAALPEEALAKLAARLAASQSPH